VERLFAPLLPAAHASVRTAVASVARARASACCVSFPAAASPPLDCRLPPTASLAGMKDRRRPSGDSFKLVALAISSAASSWSGGGSLGFSGSGSAVRRPPPAATSRASAASTSSLRCRCNSTTVDRSTSGMHKSSSSFKARSKCSRTTSSAKRSPSVWKPSTCGRRVDV